MQFARVIRIERDLQRANPAVLDVESALVPDLRDPLVVEAEASNAQVEERSSIVSLDVGRQHACRCLRCAPAGWTGIDDRRNEPARRQFASDRASDDARADDYNVSHKTTIDIRS